jgi:NADH-quinone oxidoreductase subunit M
MTGPFAQELGTLQSLNLNQTFLAAITFVIGSVASMGMPGFSGFIASAGLIGAWQTFPAYAILAGIGIIIGVAYTLRRC